MEDDARYFTMRAEQELRLAAGTTNRFVKTAHLNMAARYAALREQASDALGTDETAVTPIDDGSVTSPGLPQPAENDRTAVG